MRQFGEQTTMSSFHYADRRRARLEMTMGDPEHRLSRWQSILVIAGLAVLCWAILIAAVLAIWSTF
jgi:hypothetical protein